MPVGVNLTSTWLGGGDPLAGGPTRWGAWALGTLLLIGFLLAAPGGFLRPERYGRRGALGRVTATLFTVLFAGVSYLGATAGWPLPLALAPPLPRGPALSP